MTAKRKTRPAPDPPEPVPEAAAPAAPETRPSFGHVFRDPALLERALTHRSLASETSRQGLAGPEADNEQLEFLGDAVLGLVVAELLFRRFPQSREGELTRLRASLVSRKHLGEMAARMDLGSQLRLGKGEERSGGRAKSALLSNALEAVIAAIYLDGGLDSGPDGGPDGGLAAAARFIERTIVAPALPGLDLALAVPAADHAGSAVFSGAVGDHKSALQEHLQAIGAGQPQYVLTAETGPDHRKRFRVEVRVADTSGGMAVLAESEGPTKKAAQQEAARLAFGRLMRELEPVPTASNSQPELADDGPVPMDITADPASDSVRP